MDTRKELTDIEVEYVMGGGQPVFFGREQAEDGSALKSSPWGKAWGEGGWGSAAPQNGALSSSPWGKAWGEGGWGSAAPQNGTLSSSPWGKAWGEGGWGSARPGM